MSLKNYEWSFASIYNLRQIIETAIALLLLTFCIGLWSGVFTYFLITALRDVYWSLYTLELISGFSSTLSLKSLVAIIK